MHRSFFVILLSAIGLMAMLPVASSADPQPSNLDRTILSEGHADAVAPHFEDGQIEVLVKDDTGGAPVFREPEDVLFHVRPGAETALPPEGDLPPSFDFLYEIGNPVWMLPLTQDPGLLWPGWSSETIPAGQFEGGASGELDWKLTGMYGQDGGSPPAGFALWDSDSFGGPRDILFNTPLGYPQTKTMPTGVHAHYFWTFGAEGLYRFCFDVSGTPAGGSEVSSGPVEYRFFVGDLADLPADVEGEPCAPVERTLSITGLSDLYRPGDLLSLGLTFDPEEDHPHVHWYEAAPGSDVWEEIGGGLTLEKTLSLADDGTRIKAVHGHGDEELESEPVTVKVEEEVDPVERTLSVTGLNALYRAGDLLSLGLNFDPAEAHPHVHWYASPAGGNVWDEVGQGTTFEKTLSLADDGTRIKAVHGHGDEELESRPVTVNVKDEVAVLPRFSGRLTPLGPKTVRAAHKKGSLRARVRTSVPGSAVISAFVSRKAIRRMGLKSRPASRVMVGSASVRLAEAGSRTAKIRLRPALRRGLARMKRNVLVRYEAEVKTDDGRARTLRASQVLFADFGSPAGRATDAAHMSAKRTVIAQGHVDAVSARIVKNRLRFQLKDDTGARPVWRNPGTVLIKVRPGAGLKLPEGMGFVGPQGKTVWMIPQVERRGIVWAGWNTEEISSSQIKGQVNYALTRVSGPGKAVIFQTGSFGDHDVLFNSGTRLPQRMSVPTGTHAHANWAFTRKGTYRMTFRLSARSASGEAMSDSGVLMIKVG